MPPIASTVPTKGPVLAWAREYAGFTVSEAAEELGISADALQLIEADNGDVTDALFNRLKQLYRQTESILLMPAPPEGVSPPADFRSVGTAKTRLTRATLAVIRDSRRIQHLVSELLDEAPELLGRANIGSGDLGDDPEAVAERERAKFNVSVDAQFKAGTRADSYNKWRARVQEFGIVVTQKRMQWDDCRGFSLWGHGLVPLICVNFDDSENGRTFTLFHEYGHLVFRNPGACLTGPGNEVLPAELWCNRFAAAFLMPRHALINVIERDYQSLRSPSEWKPGDVERLATRFRVSRYAMGHRLRELGITRLYDQIANEWYRADRRAAAVRKPRPGQEFRREPTERTVVREYGIETVSMVLNAVREDVIDPGEAADILELPLDKLSKADQLAKDQRRDHAFAV